MTKIASDVVIAKRTAGGGAFASGWSLCLGGVAASLAVVAVLYDSSLKAYAANADLLYVPSFINDVFRGRSITFWRLPPAGYYSPEMVLYALAHLIFRDFRHAVVFTAFLQVALFLAGGAFLFRSVGGRRALHFVLPLLAALAVVFELAIHFGGPYVDVWLGGMVVTGTHFGSVLSAVWALALLFAARRESGRTLAFGGFVAVALAGALSDSLFVVWFCGPVVVSLAICGRVVATERGASWWGAGLALCAVAVIAIVVQQRFNGTSTEYAQRISLYASFAAGHREWALLGRFLTPLPDYGGYARPLSTAAALTPLLVSVIWALTLLVKRRPHAQPPNDDADRRALLVCIGAVCGVSTVLSPAALALFIDYTSIKYVTMAFFLPLVCLLCATVPQIEVRLMEFRRMEFLSAGIGRHGLVALDIVIIVWFFSTGGFQRPLAPPAELACLPTGPAAGLADYWRARPLTLFSGERLQVEPLAPLGDPFWWINNRRWFSQTFDQPHAFPPYRFIVMEGLDAGPIAGKFGPPSRRVPCAGSEIWYYDEPGQLAQAADRVFRRLLPQTP